MKKNPTDLNEQVFETRNKAYGAYKLRKAYMGILIGAAIFVGLWLVFIFGGVPHLGGNFGQGKKAVITNTLPPVSPQIKGMLPPATDTTPRNLSTATLLAPETKSRAELEKERFRTPNERAVPVVITRKPTPESDESKPQTAVPELKEDCYFGPKDVFGVYLDKEAQPLNLVQKRRKIQYPETLKDNRVSGKAIFKLLVDQEGKVREYRLVTSTDPAFTQAVEPILM